MKPDIDIPPAKPASSLVSVVMPAYNAARFLEDAVQSVIQQDYTHWELLIVNDASTDNTLEIAERLSAGDPRIHVFDQKVNGGVARTRNTALDNATGRYIAFLDSDDLWKPDKLSRQVAFMEANDVLVCYGSYRRIDEEGNSLGMVVPPDVIKYQDLLRSNFIGNLTGIYDAQRLGKEYLTDFRHEDYVAWLALVRRAGEARAIKAELGVYRVYTGSTSSNKFRTLAWQWHIYRRAESLGFFHSCLLMLTYSWHAIGKRIRRPGNINAGISQS